MDPATRKRAIDEEEKDQQKRMKVADIDASLIIRCLVDAKKVGSLIGRQGSVITSFREQSGAWVDISSSVPGATRRIMTVKGNLQTVCIAFQLIATRLAESRQQNMERNQQQGGGSGEETADISIEFLVGAAQAGAIIGKGGAKINAVRQETQCRIKISSDCLPMSTEKTVNCRGPVQSVTAAAQHIITGLAEVTDRPPRQLYNPMPETPAYGGYYGGMAGMAPQAQGMYGGYGQQAAAMGGMGAPQGMPPQAQMAQQTLVLPVPEAVMGGVIGRRGANINEVRQRSGASIKIPQSDPSSTERMLTITGSPQANELAIALIHQKIAAAQAMQSARQ